MPVSSRLQGSKTRSAKSVKSIKLSQCYCSVHENIRWRPFKKTILSKSLSVILHLLADSIIPAVLKRRSTSALGLLGSVELALTKDNCYYPSVGTENKGY